MQILINSDNEITSYATIGGFENGIEVDNYPDSFVEVFEPRMFKYVDGSIVKNENYNFVLDDQSEMKDSYEQRIASLEDKVKELYELINPPQA